MGSIWQSDWIWSCLTSKIINFPNFRSRYHRNVAEIFSPFTKYKLSRTVSQLYVYMPSINKLFYCRLA